MKRVRKLQARTQGSGESSADKLRVEPNWDGTKGRSDRVEVYGGFGIYSMSTQRCCCRLGSTGERVSGSGQLLLFHLLERKWLGQRLSDVSSESA